MCDCFLKDGIERNDVILVPGIVGQNDIDGDGDGDDGNLCIMAVMIVYY
jgi:hypothetical protein